MQILLGCGHSRVKKLSVTDSAEWTDLVTVDMNEDVKPDILWDLSRLPYPFEDSIADEIHAYDVLEHMGQQGDWRFFFAQWTELWRILKPGGFFIGISPKWNGKWAWGDPGHTRVVQPEQFIYLHQPSYGQVGSSPLTDYRFCWKGDFDIAVIEDTPGQPDCFSYVLQAVKPARLEV